MTTPDERATQLCEFIESQKTVVFPEITKRFDWAQGEIFFLFSEHVVLWTHVSQELIDAIHTLCNRKRIWATPCDAFGYIVAGKTLKWSIASLLGTYDKTHWLPVNFTTERPV